MDDRSRRFVKLGVLGTALEDPNEQDVLVDFFVNTLLPLEVTSKKISELIVTVLTKELLIGSGDNSFQTLSARNKVNLDAIYEYLDKTFGVEWRKKD